MCLKDFLTRYITSNVAQRALTGLVLSIVISAIFFNLPPLYTTLMILTVCLYAAFVELPHLASPRTRFYWILLFFYMAPGTICMVMMNYSYFFRNFLFVLAVLVVKHDTAAYIFGNFFGKTPLAPSLSPRKTIEGSLGAFAAVLTVSLFFLFHANIKLNSLYAQKGLFSKKMATSYPWQFVVLSAYALTLFLSVLGTAGDLFESYLKRRAGVKDSGTILPGHGGILDRIDSLLFVVPIIYPLTVAIIFYMLADHVTLHQVLFEKFWKIGQLKYLNIR